MYFENKQTNKNSYSESRFCPNTLHFLILDARYGCSSISKSVSDTLHPLILRHPLSKPNKAPSYSWALLLRDLLLP